jgi:hypothetical protein
LRTIVEVLNGLVPCYLLQQPLPLFGIVSVIKVFAYRFLPPVLLIFELLL